MSEVSAEVLYCSIAGPALVQRPQRRLGIGGDLLSPLVPSRWRTISISA